MVMLLIETIIMKYSRRSLLETKHPSVVEDSKFDKISKNGSE